MPQFNSAFHRQVPFPGRGLGSWPAPSLHAGLLPSMHIGFPILSHPVSSCLSRALSSSLSTSKPPAPAPASYLAGYAQVSCSVTLSPPSKASRHMEASSRAGCITRAQTRQRVDHDSRQSGSYADPSPVPNASVLVDYPPANCLCKMRNRGASVTCQSPLDPGRNHRRGRRSYAQVA